MLNENKKFVIVLALLVFITILNLLALLQQKAIGQESQKSVPVLADDPTLRQPGGYHYDRVLRLTLAAQKKINVANPNLDIEKCKAAYLAYYSRQSEEEAKNALSTIIRECEK